MIIKFNMDISIPRNKDSLTAQFLADIGGYISGKIKANGFISLPEIIKYYGIEKYKDFPNVIAHDFYWYCHTPDLLKLHIVGEQEV